MTLRIAFISYQGRSTADASNLIKNKQAKNPQYTLSFSSMLNCRLLYKEDWWIVILKFQIP